MVETGRAGEQGSQETEKTARTAEKSGSTRVVLVPREVPKARPGGDR